MRFLKILLDKILDLSDAVMVLILITILRTLNSRSPRINNDALARGPLSFDKLLMCCTVFIVFLRGVSPGDTVNEKQKNTRSISHASLIPLACDNL